MRKAGMGSLLLGISAAMLMAEKILGFEFAAIEDMMNFVRIS